MKIKGKYIAQIELNFCVDPSIGNATLQEFKENMNELNERVGDILATYVLDNSHGISSTLKLTQKRLDIYEVDK